MPPICPVAYLYEESPGQHLYYGVDCQTLRPKPLYHVNANHALGCCTNAQAGNDPYFICVPAREMDRLGSPGSGHQLKQNELLEWPHTVHTAEMAIDAFDHFDCVFTCGQNEFYCRVFLICVEPRINDRYPPLYLARGFQRRDEPPRITIRAEAIKVGRKLCVEELFGVREAVILLAD